MLKKTILLPVIVLTLLSGLLHAQNFNWITPGTTYLKLYVVNEGLARINRQDFINSGINTSSIDPRTVKVIYQGAEVPIYFSGEQDGIFNDGDYLDFFGYRNSGGLTNTYNQNNIVIYTTNEYYNQYSDTNAYWIGWGGVNGLRFLNSNFATSNLYPSDFYFQTLHFEKDKIYSQGENVQGDTRFLNTEKCRGEGWYWSLLSTNQSVSDTFSIPALFNQPQNATLRIFAYPLNGSNSITNEHSIEIYANGNLITTIYSDNVTTLDFKKIDTTITFSSSLLSATSVNNISLKYVAASGFAGQMFIDLFELKYPQSFKITDKKLSADLVSVDTTSKLFRISGYSAASTINIYDVRNNIRISNISSNADTLKFTAKNNAKLEIVNDSVRNKPVRIIQRQVPDLVSGSNGADYLLVYHSDFLDQAEQLRAYRQTTDNYRSVKSNIQDIYDIFNYGKEDPIALKRFVKHVYDFWQLPKVKYVCLFGRGSLDPKKNSLGSNFHNNFIPVYGNPPTDGYYSNFNIGTFFYYDMVSIGRIPAYYPSEAQTMVDKIIAYENEQPDRWYKTFSYITGGATFAEQQSYQQRSNFEINQYITPCPISGEGVKIYRNDTSGTGTFNYADSIKNTVNRGTSYINFRGHAGSHDWEVGMSDPNILSNGNKLPLVLSLTCFTGENSKSEFRGFGEKWMYLSGKGAIGFISTTGWSFENSGNDFGTYIIQTIKLDSTRKLGEMTKSAGKSMSADSLNFAIRHTVNCYKLLGDPAVKLKLPKYPEFAIKNTDYKLSTESVTLNEPVTLKITPKDYGLCADTCLIRFQLKKNGINYSIKDTAYLNFKFLDTVLHTFKIDTPGVYTMTVILDQNNRYPQEIESNNTITFNIPYAEYAYLPVSPVNNSISYKDSIELSGLNPRLSFSQNSVRVLLQLDTSRLFNSPVLQTFTNNNISGAVTKFRALLPVSINNTIYYWRTNSVINNDSTGWTKTVNFIYNNGLTLKDEEKDRFISANTSVGLLKNNINQFAESDFNNTGFYQNEIKLLDYPATLFVRSLGSNGEEASYFSVGNRNIFIDAGQNAGLSMIKVKKLNGNILEFKNLKMTATASSDSLVNFLNTFDSTQYLMLLNAAYVAGGTTLTGNAKAKLRQFGSVYCDSIGLLGYFHTWSLIGSLGAGTSGVSEMFDPCCRPAPGCVSCTHWSQSVSSMSVMFKKTSGSVKNIIGPAKEWTDFYWNSSVPPNSSLVFDIIGIDFSGNETILRQNVQTNKFVELSTIDPVQYPFLNLNAKFSIDTISGNDSPALTSLNVSYSPAAELILDKNSLQINSLERDNNITNFSFNYHNAGFAYIYGLIVNVYNGSISDPNLILTDTIPSLLKIDSIGSYSNSFTTPFVRDSTNIIINIKPRDKSNEFYTFNNSADFRITSTGSVSATTIEVTGDGKLITSGDFISKNPEIRIKMMKPDVPFILSDTLQLSVMLNGNYVPYFLSGKINPEIKTIESDQSLENFVSLIYFPVLTNGKNILSIAYKGDGDNSIDTLSYDVIVSSELMVNDLYNYPNPMRNETNFIFNLAGSVSQYPFKLKIYTVSGKLIKEIDYNANVGNNTIPWDGKDNDGDIVANGTYFYKLITGEDLNSELKVQKLVVLK